MFYILYILLTFSLISKTITAYSGTHRKMSKRRYNESQLDLRIYPTEKLMYFRNLLNNPMRHFVVVVGAFNSWCDRDFTSIRKK